MMKLAVFIAFLLLSAEAFKFKLPFLNGMKKNKGNCPPVTTMDNVNQTEFLRATWFVQKQQVVDYQPQEDFFCVAATYDIQGKKVPLFNGKVISVFNYGNKGEVNGPPTNTVNGTTLCARQRDNNDNSKLLVAPCFLPNVLAGPYWIIGAGPTASNYEWAVVSGGQPSVEYPDGCTTKTSGTNNAGLWIFSRSPVLNEKYMKDAEAVLKEKDYSMSQLLEVKQDGCKYKGAFIKGPHATESGEFSPLVQK